jgi:hypothetical protein
MPSSTPDTAVCCSSLSEQPKAMALQEIGVLGYAFKADPNDTLVATGFFAGVSTVRGAVLQVWREEG